MVTPFLCCKTYQKNKNMTIIIDLCTCQIVYLYNSLSESSGL